ncbi:hypothetical protein O6H91_21G069800 [Diphasiastrum complanatum]|uniref:Uncharacterized protein n=1 Tax=Diphasiastrum complanatum TaxID=34168 RepID=A0ACC2ANA3_DIPCM|nr:hypothetical protein O6H91_21G069800 [Diphasiastrum complanatum]
MAYEQLCMQQDQNKEHASAHCESVEVLATESGCGRQESVAGYNAQTKSCGGRQVAFRRNGSTCRTLLEILGCAFPMSVRIFSAFAIRTALHDSMF